MIILITDILVIWFFLSTIFVGIFRVENLLLNLSPNGMKMVIIICLPFIIFSYVFAIFITFLRYLLQFTVTNSRNKLTLKELWKDYFREDRYNG